jgi:hypothetical protein
MAIEQTDVFEDSKSADHTSISFGAIRLGVETGNTSAASY